MTIGTEDNIEAFGLLFDNIYKGNEEAKAISFTLLEVAHTWDDIVDGDPVTPEAVNSAFIACIFELQRYNLWQTAGLSHHILNTFLRWRDANTIEANKESTEEDLLKCFMLRAGLYDIFVIIAYHLFGDEWAREVGPTVRRYYGETTKEYLEEIRNA